MSLTELCTFSSSIRCQRQARASAFQRTVRLRLRARRKLASVRRHDALAAAAALEESVRIRT